MKKSITLDKVKEKIQFHDEERMYHVTPKWDGGDLLSLYEQLGNEAYDIFYQKYGLENGLGFDHVHYIHCHYTVEEAKEYQRIWGGQILEIDAKHLAVKHDCLEYPHPMVRDIIPKEYVRLL